MAPPTTDATPLHMRPFESAELERLKEQVAKMRGTGEWNGPFDSPHEGRLATALVDALDHIDNWQDWV